MPEAQQQPNPFATGLRGFIQTNHTATAAREQFDAAQQRRLAAVSAAPQPAPIPAEPPKPPAQRITAVRRGREITPKPVKPVTLTSSDAEDLNILLSAFRDFQREESERQEARRARLRTKGV